MSNDEKYTKKRHVLNDDIPYEVQMKFLIEAYRRDLKRLEDLSNYVKGLEEENLLLTKKLEKADTVLAERRDYEATIKRMQLEINQLKGTITKTFPVRVAKMRDMKKKVASLINYIFELQTLLKKNGIPYKEREVTPSRSESIDFANLDIFAVRGPKEKFEITEE